MKLRLLLSGCCLTIFSATAVYGQPAPAAQVPQPTAAANLVNAQPPSAKQDTTTTLVDPNMLVCSVYAGGFDWTTLSYSLKHYTTYKVEDSCNAIEFQKLTMASISTQLQAVDTPPAITIRGGQHYYLMDVNLSPIKNPYYYLGALKFSHTGTVKISLLNILRGLAPNISSVVTSTYTPFVLQSDLYYIWDAGTLIHRLVSPEGKQYMMFAYTKSVNTSLTREGLVDIGPTLTFPPGWKYENILLSKNITIRTSMVNRFESKVLFDDLQNFYIQYDD